MFWTIPLCEDNRLKFFLDTANLDELKKAAEWGIVDGVTTNPSLIAKEGVALEDQIRRICDIIDGAFAADGALASHFPACPAAQRKSCRSLISYVRDRPGHDHRYAIDATKARQE